MKAVFHFNRIEAYSIVSISLVLPECSRNSEILFCYDTAEVENGRENITKYNIYKEASWGGGWWIQYN